MDVYKVMARTIEFLQDAWLMDMSESENYWVYISQPLSIQMLSILFGLEYHIDENSTYHNMIWIATLYTHTMLDERYVDFVYYERNELQWVREVKRYLDLSCNVIPT